MEWFNVFGLVFIVVIMIPNIIFAVNCKEGFENRWKNKAIEIIEQMDIAYGKFAQENRDLHLTCPVLLLLGDKDKTGKVKQYCSAWAETTGYPLHIIEDAAHFSNGDNAEQVNSEIEQFVIQTTVG